MLTKCDCVKCGARLPGVPAFDNLAKHYCYRCRVLLNIGGATKFGSGLGPQELGGRYDDWRTRQREEPVPLVLHDVASWPEI